MEGKRVDVTGAVVVEARVTASLITLTICRLSRTATVGPGTAGRHKITRGNRADVPENVEVEEGKTEESS